MSNLKKYADKSQPVVFLTQLQEGVLSVCLSNTVRKDLNLVESTKIGLRTCEKIMQAMEGSFAVQKDDTHFAATFSLPIKK